MFSTYISVPSRGLSYLNENISDGTKTHSKGFRPLTGTLLSKLGSNPTYPVRKVRVFVPSRGLSYLNECMTISEFSKIVVSVPSRGLSYLNSSSCWLSSSSFSSFRPLTGTLLSKHSFLMNPVEVRGQVSVPSRGLSYLNINPNIFYSDFSQSGFRPLTGTLLSKRKGYKNKSYQIIRVSVPSRGLSYLNSNSKK